MSRRRVPVKWWDMEENSVGHAKDHLDELLVRAARGEDVRITDPRLGTIRLLAVKPAPSESDLYPERVPGRWKGRLAEIPDEVLLAPLSEEELGWLSGEQSGNG